MARLVVGGSGKGVGFCSVLRCFVVVGRNDSAMSRNKEWKRVGTGSETSSGPIVPLWAEKPLEKVRLPRGKSVEEKKGCAFLESEKPFRRGGKMRKVNPSKRHFRAENGAKKNWVETGFERTEEKYANFLRTRQSFVLGGLGVRTEKTRPARPNGRKPENSRGRLALTGLGKGKRKRLGSEGDVYHGLNKKVMKRPRRFPERSGKALGNAGFLELRKKRKGKRQKRKCRSDTRGRRVQKKGAAGKTSLTRRRAVPHRGTEGVSTITLGGRGKKNCKKRLET